MAKINWIAAEKEYTNDITLSYADIAKRYGVSVTAVENKASKEEWTKKRRFALVKIGQRLEEKTANTIVEHQARLMNQARFVAGIGLQGMARLKPRSAREAKELWEAATTLQVKVLGLDKPNIHVGDNVQNNNFIGWDQVISELERRKQLKGSQANV